MYLKTPVRIIVKDDVIAYVPPKAHNHIIYILDSSGLVSASCPQPNGQWQDMPLIQSLPFKHGQSLLVGDPNQRSEKICRLTLTNLMDYKQYVDKGICIYRMGGRICLRS